MGSSATIKKFKPGKKYRVRQITFRELFSCCNSDILTLTSLESGTEVRVLNEDFGIARGQTVKPWWCEEVLDEN